jgi:hypothetical protein
VLARDARPHGHEPGTRLRVGPAPGAVPRGSGLRQRLAVCRNGGGGGGGGDEGGGEGRRLEGGGEAARLEGEGEERLAQGAVGRAERQPVQHLVGCAPHAQAAP